ncbi:hypothetical protein SAY87_011331 [Trapa incisa]|uniref:Uncharacterized protein n=1 Tax=Trapa incisa TaxID=236973 RepID=A0AAN7GW47_9MYRT|nr:hypothetical protein SAY87_011331 [Trapa incisa]
MAAMALTNDLARSFHNIPYLAPPCGGLNHMGNSGFYYCREDDYGVSDTAGDDEHLLLCGISYFKKANVPDKAADRTFSFNALFMQLLAADDDLGSVPSPEGNERDEEAIAPCGGQGCL